MGYYRVFLRGENFILEVDSEAGCLGFYTTRFVEAKGRGAAEILAVDLIRGDRTLAGVKNTRDNPPMIYVEEIEEIAMNEVQSSSGYTFFRMDERHSSVSGELARSITSRILLISEKGPSSQSEILPVKGGYSSNISAIRFAYFLAAFSGLCEIDPIAVPRQTIFSDVTSIRSTTVVASK
jgi:hypothetical protein